MTDQKIETGSPGDGAVETVKGVAERTVDRAGDVAGEVKAQFRAVAVDAKSQARDLFDRGRHDLDREVSARSQQAAGGVRTLADQVGALADGDIAGAGPLTDLLRDGQQRLRTFAGRLDDGPAAVLEDLRRFARRQPVLFLAAAGGLGFLAGRFARAARGGDDDQSSVMSARTGQRALASADDASSVVDAPLPAPELLTDAPVPNGRPGAAFP